MSTLRSAVVARRLMLAKQFYLNAVEQYRVPGSLNRLMAIHNFHIAVEIVLKAILIEHGIRSDKTLNVDFEQMLSDIDNHPPFKASQTRLPLRQEMRNLNQQRNLAQHHVVEPHQTALEECRFFVHEFLAHSFTSYFGASFDSISRAELVSDDRLRALIKRAEESLRSGDFEDSVCASSAAFEYAAPALYDTLPEEDRTSLLLFESRPGRNGVDLSGVRDVIRKTHDRVRASEMFAAKLASGISLAQLHTFAYSVPRTTLSVDGHPWFNARGPYEENHAAFAVEFLTDTLLKWQTQGITVAVDSGFFPGLDDYLARTWPRPRGAA